eukprot:6204871-Pleurochrysis_carterae.AAC.1
MFANAGEALSSSAASSVKRQRTLSKEEHAASHLKNYRRSELSTFRHRRNFGDATITAVFEFCSAMMSRVRAEIKKRANALETVSFAEMISSTFEIANIVTTTHLDKKSRASKLPSIEHQKRALGVRTTMHTCCDGHKVNSEICDYCYDQPARGSCSIQRFLHLNFNILADLLREKTPFNGTM